MSDVTELRFEGAEEPFDLDDFVEPEYEAEQTIDERFAAFHAANPWVYRTLERLAADWLERGHRKVGIKALFEVIRWQHGRRTSGDQGFRCNNDFTSRYARILLERHPEWPIETRRLRAA